MTYILRLKGFVYIVINGFHCIFCPKYMRNGRKSILPGLLYLCIMINAIQKNIFRCFPDIFHYRQDSRHFMYNFHKCKSSLRIAKYIIHVKVSLRLAMLTSIRNSKN